jgi:hypothetical protein
MRLPPSRNAAALVIQFYKAARKAVRIGIIEATDERDAIERVASEPQSPG